MSNRYFAAFIMTYERSDLLPGTIDAIIGQSVAPSKILVVDNSTSRNTEVLIENLKNPVLEYYRVGYNSGPAGAAKIGLQLLAKQGYEWIYWGDDNDPPKFADCFEILLNQRNNSIGVLGAVGTKFNWNSGVQQRYQDHELKGLLPVDSVGGGYCMLVNAHAITPETLPDDRLFFGWEEFDFCQRIKRAGFGIFASGELLYRYRHLHNKLGIIKKPSLVPRRSFDHLHREYYSYRNAIFLMAYTYKKFHLVFWYVLRAFGKMLFGYAKGFKFGSKNFKMLSTAIIHGLFARMGKGI